MDSTAVIKDYKINKNSQFFRIRANIIGSKLIHASGFHSDYAEYSLKIETDYAKWTLKKRYDEFNKLNSKLIDRIPEMKKLFPPKRLFKSTDELICERIKSFTKYFNYLFCNINIFLIEEILKFISLKKEIILLFMKKYTMLKIGEENTVFTSLKNAFNITNELEEIIYKTEKKNKSNDDIINILENENNYYYSILKYEMKRQVSFSWDEPPQNTPNLFVIKEFLNNLEEKSENKTDIIQNFEDFLKNNNKWIRLASKEIKLLFIGEDEEDEEKIRELLSKTNYIEKKRKKISSDFKYHSSLEFFEQDDDDDINNNELEDYYLNNNKRLNGIFYTIGNYNKNIILSMATLDFLYKLIDSEYNPDAEIYINIFKSLEIKHYKMLNLSKIIKSNIGGDKANLKCLKLLKLIFYDNSRDDFKKVLFEDNSVYKQYSNYINKFIE